MSTEVAPKNVLFVDDEPALLRGLIRSLSAQNFRIQTALCAAEARALLVNQPIDVLVCDHHMSGTSGLEFLAQIRAERPEIALVLLSGQVAGLSVALKWAKEIGVHAVLAKPCTSTDLIQSIEKALQCNARHLGQA